MKTNEPSCSCYQYFSFFLHCSGNVILSIPCIIWNEIFEKERMEDSECYKLVEINLITQAFFTWTT